MGKVIVFIAASLDGFIARKDDDISWLDAFSASGEDYGFGKFIQSAGTAVMGAGTYEQSLAHPERLLKGLKNYILTSRSLPRVPGMNTEFWHDSLPALVGKIREESERDIYLVGGGQVISRFLYEGLVDEVPLFLVPVILGEGIPLFTGLSREISLQLVGTLPYPAGIVRLQYVPEPSPSKR